MEAIVVVPVLASVVASMSLPASAGINPLSILEVPGRITGRCRNLARHPLPLSWRRWGLA